MKTFIKLSNEHFDLVIESINKLTQAIEDYCAGKLDLSLMAAQAKETNRIVVLYCEDDIEELKKRV